LKTTEEKRVYFNMTVVTGARIDGGDSDRSTIPDDMTIHVESDDPENAVITGKTDFLLSDLISRNLDLEFQPNSTEYSNNSLYFTVRGVFLGYARISFYVNNSVTFESDSTNSSIRITNLPSNIQSETSSYDYAQTVSDSSKTTTAKSLPFRYKVVVVRKERIVDYMFLVGVTILVFCANMGMGCKVDLDVVKEIFKKPIAPSIGFCCQYLIMPLVSITI
jgi:hypothetical protein